MAEWLSGVEAHQRSSLVSSSSSPFSAGASADAALPLSDAEKREAGGRGKK